MKWNAAGAFIGKLVDSLPSAPTDGTDDNRSLIYDVFLETPLLPSGALYREVKFSGNEQPGNNEDLIGRVVDAYSHHVLIDSEFEILISDIQGMPCIFNSEHPSPSYINTDGFHGYHSSRP
jgi:hypothetical protein